MTQQSAVQPAFPQQLPKTQQEWQNFIIQLQQALLSPTTAAYKSSQTSLTTTSGTTDPELNLPIMAAGTYAFSCVLYISTLGATGNTPGFAMEINFSGTLATSGHAFAYVGNMDGSVASSLPLEAGVDFSLTTGSGLNSNVLFISGTFHCTTSGTLSLIWAQANASASAVNLNIGSVISVTRLN
jgi:hypothetical protein